MSKRFLAPLLGPRIRLRLLTAVDLPLTRQWRNYDHIRKWFLTSTIISAEQHAAWFAAYAERDNDFVFIIEEIQEEHYAPVGQISLYNIEWDRKRAEYGRLMIGEPAAARRGLATEATELLLAWAFDQLSLETLYLHVRHTNHSAIAVYQHCGFRLVDTQHGVCAMRLEKS